MWTMEGTGECARPDLSTRSPPIMVPQDVHKWRFHISIYEPSCEVYGGAQTGLPVSVGNSEAQVRHSRWFRISSAIAIAIAIAICRPTRRSVALTLAACLLLFCVFLYIFFVVFPLSLPVASSPLPAPRFLPFSNELDVSRALVLTFRIAVGILIICPLGFESWMPLWFCCTQSAQGACWGEMRG